MAINMAYEYVDIISVIMNVIYGNQQIYAELYDFLDGNEYDIMYSHFVKSYGLFAMFLL